MPRINLERYNDRIEDWSKKAQGGIRKSGEGMGIIHRSDSPNKRSSLAKIRTVTRRQDGAVNQISVRFSRTLVFPHKGAGKGMAGTKGSRWIDKYGQSKSTNPKSFGKMGTGNRKEKPFINEYLNSPEGTDEVATIAATELGDAIVNNILVK